jgi:N-methylhydantoinase B
MGASARADGNYVYIFPANGANTPVEILESDTPLIVEKRELVADSGGIGRMKGAWAGAWCCEFPMMPTHRFPR